MSQTLRIVWTASLVEAYPKFIDLTEEVFRLTEALEEPRGGGYLCIGDVEAGGEPFILLSFGRIPNEKAERYRINALEKARRLAAHSGLGHVSSWQSRNEAASQWGGAVRAGGGIIISFSGTPEHYDELICVRVARALGLHVETARIKLASDNPLL